MDTMIDLRQSSSMTSYCRLTDSRNGTLAVAKWLSVSTKATGSKEKGQKQKSM